MDRRWPIGIAAALLLVVAVNLAVAWYAINNPPQVVESYERATR